LDSKLNKYFTNLFMLNIEFVKLKNISLSYFELLVLEFFNVIYIKKKIIDIYDKYNGFNIKFFI